MAIRWFLDDPHGMTSLNGNLYGVATDEDLARFLASFEGTRDTAYEIAFEDAATFYRRKRNRDLSEWADRVVKITRDYIEANG